MERNIAPTQPPPFSPLGKFLLTLCALAGFGLCIIGALNDSKHSADMIQTGALLMLVALLIAVIGNPTPIIKALRVILRRLL